MIDKDMKLAGKIGRWVSLYICIYFKLLLMRHLQINFVGQKARSNDTGGIRKDLSKLVLPPGSTNGLVPILAESKGDRGFNHPYLAELLCPVGLLELFHEDEAE